MGILAKLAVAGIAGIGLHHVRKGIREDRRRRDTPCDFSEGISEDDLLKMAIDACHGIKRLIDIDVNGPVVMGTMRSQSGASEWDFSIDFNDWGHITGSYWIRSDNDDSGIPSLIADRISGSIHECLEDVESEDRETTVARCPKCGSNLRDPNARFCSKCGNPLRDKKSEESVSAGVEAKTKDTAKTFAICYLAFFVCILLLLFMTL